MEESNREFCEDMMNAGSNEIPSDWSEFVEGSNVSYVSETSNISESTTFASESAISESTEFTISESTSVAKIVFTPTNFEDYAHIAEEKSITPTAMMESAKKFRAVCDLCLAIASLQINDTMHGDYNKNNLIVNTKDGSLTLIDFGMAVVLPPECESPAERGASKHLARVEQNSFFGLAKQILEGEETILNRFPQLKVGAVGVDKFDEVDKRFTNLFWGSFHHFACKERMKNIQSCVQEMRQEGLDNGTVWNE
eukprot:TRINITY_DN303690_c0_g2_i1.p1 TRINITY_DN303690_c0_g2~~TRINITY_DN303690_c0_g2_i1.p1  ORF type:complete len:270 (-),score=59.98 TRINITY_DN303690_c0_g2_i1:48-806(-)